MSAEQTQPVTPDERRRIGEFLDGIDQSFAEDEQLTRELASLLAQVAHGIKLDDVAISRVREILRLRLDDLGARRAALSRLRREVVG